MDKALFLNSLRKNDKEEIKRRFEEMDELLYEVEKEVKAFKNSNQKLKKTLDKMKILEEFYHSEEWLQGREILLKRSEEKSFYSAGEDAIWNLSNDLYNEKIAMLKIITQTL